MPNRGKLAVTAGIAIGLIALGLILRTGQLIALSLPFVLYMMVFLLLQPSSSKPPLEIERHLSGTRIEEGGKIEVVLTVVNHGAPIPSLGLTENFPPGIEVTEGETSCLRSLGTEERTTLTYTLRSARGVHQLPGVDVKIWKWLALTPQSVFLPHEDHFIALPQAEIIDDIEIRPQRTRAYAGMVRANRGGSGLDFFGCRAYTPGDDIRYINWRTYAKRGELVIDEYEQERIADVSIILDGRERMNTREGKEDTFTYSVRAAACMASHFIDQGNSVGLLIYGDYINWTYPGYGKTQRERILEALAQAKPGYKEVFSDLHSVPTRLFPSRSQLIIVSPLAGEDDVEVLGVLRARGYQIIVIIPDLLQVQLERLPDDENRDLAQKIVQLRRNFFLSTLTRIGVEVLVWNIAEPLSYPISWGLSRRGRRLG